MLGRLLRRKSRFLARPLRWELSDELLRWTRNDIWTIRDSVAGTLIVGATGSGKTTGSGATIARSMLSANYGGLVLTAKAEERALWESYCRETGRLDDLCVFGLNEPLRFNFLDYEFNRDGAGGGITENIVALFSTILEVAERNTGSGGGRDEESYWKRASPQLLRNLIDLLVLATGKVSVPDLVELCLSAPTSRAQLSDRDWQNNSFCFHCLKGADQREKTARQQHDFGVVVNYFLLDFANLSEKTRSIVVSTFTSMADLFVRGILVDLFCTTTNITPEATLDGKIILIDLPAKEFAELGIFANVLWKHVFERSIERRNVAANPRPVFLWCDEMQTFLTSYDMQFQTTCRSARVATILLTQNVSNVHAALGGSEKARSEAASLFGNLNTKILHANGDPVTNEWASSLMGRSRQFFLNCNNTFSHDDYLNSMFGLGSENSSNAGLSESYEFEVQPAEFTRLKSGGPGDNWLVEGIVFQNGRVFRSSGRTWLPVTFRQK